jgi:chitinase
LKKSNPKLVTLLAVGGYNQGATSLSKMADDPNLRSNFARKAVDFIQKWGFDGLSLDWQFTSGTRAERFKNRRNFVQLLNVCILHNIYDV